MCVCVCVREYFVCIAETNINTKQQISIRIIEEKNDTLSRLLPLNQRAFCQRNVCPKIDLFTRKFNKKMRPKGSFA